MEESFVDRAVLEEAVDSLLKMKDYSQFGEDEYSSLREEMIGELDEKISNVVFSDLSDEQLDELEALLDNNETDENVFDEFFNKHNIDLQSKIKGCVKEFRDDFLSKGDE